MKFKSLLLIGIFLVQISCSNEDNDFSVELPFSYDNTSVYLTSTQEADKKVIEIGGKTFVVNSERVFPVGQESVFKPVFRIPSITYTNKGTILVASENRETALDKEEIDIVLSRHTEAGSGWNISRIWRNDSKTYGRSMNPVFLIDRLGITGLKGRIFLFSCHFLQGVGYANDAKTNEFDIVYKYSDDDGLSWSPEYSIKDYCDFSQYDIVIPSAANGIQLGDGTFLLPTMVSINTVWHSGVLYRKPEGKWVFSCPTPNEGDNECTVYIDNIGRIILDSRTTDKVRRKYSYDMDKDVWNLVSEAPVSLNIKAEIIRGNLEGKDVYLTSFPDTQEEVRENITLFGSKDGSNWKRICLIQEGMCHFGYSNIALFNNHLSVTFETYLWGTRVIDLSSFSHIIVDEIYN